MPELLTMKHVHRAFRDWGEVLDRTPHGEENGMQPFVDSLNRQLGLNRERAADAGEVPSSGVREALISEVHRRLPDVDRVTIASVLTHAAEVLQA
ncbi:hypothetical protein ACIBHX_01860 [Nonomuraea sp. NPDC050536]|uniref:hypothetical protein n=1 Tax=Nonomuraea sp. NPDC050536 TaxID=3364366 RepID=UPI0037C8AC25